MPPPASEHDRALVAAHRARGLALEADERTRVAREIQDLVTHALTAITVQTAAARRLLPEDPDTADQLLAAVEQAGREAAEEMRALALLGPDEAPARRPQPDLAQLDELVASARDDGLQVDLASAGAPRRVDPGVALTAYRVVEQALAAARGDAHHCRVRIALGWRSDVLEVAVEEDGPVVLDPALAARDGLLGERVRAYGGRLRASARAGGGFAVSVTLPTSRSTA